MGRHLDPTTLQLLRRASALLCPGSRRRWLGFGLLASCGLWTGCGDNQDPVGAAALWNALQDADYAETWDRAPGYEQRRSSNAPHGDRVDIYVNDVLAAALDGGEPLTAWPNGSAVVKDGFDGGDLELVAVMEKRLTGWYWAEYSPDGDAIYSGEPDLCIDCHGSGDDFVRAFPLP